MYRREFPRGLRLVSEHQASSHSDPGDNDWTDCHGVVARQFEPLERLAKVRTMFFPEGGASASARYPSSAKSPTRSMANSERTFAGRSAE